VGAPVFGVGLKTFQNAQTGRVTLGTLDPFTLPYAHGNAPESPIVLFGNVFSPPEVIEGIPTFSFHFIPLFFISFTIPWGACMLSLHPWQYSFVGCPLLF